MFLLQVFINEKHNTIAEKSYTAVMDYIRRNRKLGVHIDGNVNVVVAGDDAKAILEQCKLFNDTSCTIDLYLIKLIISLQPNKQMFLS